jgi:hypothetical protein
METTFDYGNHRMIKLLLVIGIITFPFLGIWQWGDFTDSGYNAMEVQNFFARLKEGNLSSPRLLSYGIGALWWKVFPSLGLLGLFCLAATLIVAASFAPLYALSNNIKNKNAVLFGCLAAQSFYVRSVISFDYDVIAIFFSSWAAAFMVRGILNGCKMEILLSGAFVAFATLSRTSSLVSVLIGICPLFYAWFFLITNKSKLTDIKLRKSILFGFNQVAFFFTGFIFVLFIAFVALFSADLWEAYLKGFEYYLSTSSSNSSSGAYSFSKLLNRYLADMPQLFFFSLVAVAWVAASVFFSNYRINYIINIIFSLLSAIILLYWVAFGGQVGYLHPFKFLVIGFYGVATALVVLGFLDTPIVFRLAAFAGCVLTLSSIAGSNTGILKASGGLFFLVPVCTVAMTDSLASTKIFGNPTSLRIPAFVAALLLFLGSASARMCQVYHSAYGWKCRLTFTETVNESNLRGIRTTKARAEYLNSVLPLIAQYTDTDRQHLYIYGHSPIFYFLNDKDSFIPEIWFANEAYSVSSIISKLTSQIQKSGSKPVIVVTEREALGANTWIHMQEFLEKTNYLLVYTFPANSNGLKLEIWKSE